MQIFLKKIKPQEWGYSGEEPGQRGKYLLIPMDCWDFFPALSSGTRNSFCSIRVRLPNNLWIGLIYVWHNTFNFPEVALKRKHNEKRLYSNSLVNEGLQLDKDVIICLARSSESETDFFSSAILPSDSEYSAVLHLLNSKNATLIDQQLLADNAPRLHGKIVRQVELVDDDEDQSLANTDEIIEEAKKRLVAHLGPTVLIGDDPLIALASSFKTQSDFSCAVRKIYKGKCALRESYIYKDHPVGLEAAHIHAKYNGGNYLPSNGILLSTDLHRAFDEGIWTLDDELRVVVHDKINDGILMDFRGKELAIPLENIAFKPHLSYVKWHRDNRFGMFTRLVE